ncbi:Hypp1549 [Branchiostoma lanceolatum]|uniref:Hypp1549 protein n=1 Tax=Branchiostoma lanceolatum TaxID=7740 RepID=A0A8K0ENU8_BRALA|nr:Hypp1549 [Branchiostoma lanceolatum]
MKFRLVGRNSTSSSSVTCPDSISRMKPALVLLVAALAISSEMRTAESRATRKDVARRQGGLDDYTLIRFGKDVARRQSDLTDYTLVRFGRQGDLDDLDWNRCCKDLGYSRYNVSGTDAQDAEGKFSMGGLSSSRKVHFSIVLGETIWKLYKPIHCNSLS